MHEFLLTPTLSISFQRYPYPPTGVVAALPTSWGALPFLTGEPGHLVLPCPDGEAFWVGLLAEAGGQRSLVRVVASVASGDRLDVVTGAPPEDPSPAGSGDLPVPPRRAVAGIARGDGTWWAFARDTGGTPAPACQGLEVLSRPAASVRVDLVEPGHYEALGGDRLPGLDPAGRYGGWRLP